MLAGHSRSTLYCLHEGYIFHVDSQDFQEIPQNPTHPRAHLAILFVVKSCVLCSAVGAACRNGRSATRSPTTTANGKLRRSGTTIVSTERSHFNLFGCRGMGHPTLNLYLFTFPMHLLGAQSQIPIAFVIDTFVQGFGLMFHRDVEPRSL